jgi:predicted molibdopterin-dependent oxidoreductase YjgC
LLVLLTASGAEEVGRVAGISIKINGKSVSAYAGASVLEAARKTGVEIPTLCHHPLLAPTGYCGVCVVEDLGSGRLITACDTPVSPGMDVSTDSPRVIEARRRILALILSDHPETCVICEKGNACRLRELSSNLGLAFTGSQRLGHLRGIVDANPFIHRDLSKCIGCQLCVRACREIQGAEAVEFTWTGLKGRPLVTGDREMGGSACELCGLCVSLCPVGALIEKPTSHTGVEEQRVAVICPYCGVGCSLFVRVRDNEVIGVQAGVPGSVNDLSLCVKGRYGLGYVHHGERLTKPLVREGEDLVEATWDEALSKVAEGLKRTVKDHGPDSVGVLASAKATNEENYLLQKFARAVVGTNNVDHCARL